MTVIYYPHEEVLKSAKSGYSQPVGYSCGLEALTGWWWKAGRKNQAMVFSQMGTEWGLGDCWVGSTLKRFPAGHLLPGVTSFVELSSGETHWWPENHAPSHSLHSFWHRQSLSDCPTLHPRGLKNPGVKKTREFSVTQYLHSCYNPSFPLGSADSWKEVNQFPLRDQQGWVETNWYLNPDVSPPLRIPEICIKTNTNPSNFDTELDLTTTGQSNLLWWSLH